MMLELIAACGLMATLLLVSLNLVALTAAERRTIERRVVAQQEAANLIERVAALPWGEITDERLATFKLSPGAQLRASRRDRARVGRTGRRQSASQACARRNRLARPGRPAPAAASAALLATRRRRRLAMRKHSASARSAYSLVEMVFVIGLGAVLMSVLAILVTQVLAANTASREHAEGITIIGSLAEQFRRDVHSASAIDRQAGPPERLQISRADGTRIDYEIIDGGVRRDELATARSPIARRTSFAACVPSAGTTTFATPAK